MLELPIKLDLADIGRLAFAPQPGQPSPQWLSQTCPSEMMGLTHQVDVALGWGAGRLVQFLASRSGEGCSSVATSYASLAAASLGREVLLIETVPTTRGPSLNGEPFDTVPGLADAFLAGRPVTDAVRVGAGSLYVATLARDCGDAAFAALSRPAFWAEIKGIFDEVVLDSPAAETGQAGLMASSHADAVVVVVEAERTPEPVVRRLLDDLAMSRANVIGTVLNKRRFRLPRFLLGRS